MVFVTQNLTENYLVSLTMLGGGTLSVNATSDHQTVFMHSTSATSNGKSTELEARINFSFLIHCHLGYVYMEHFPQEIEMVFWGE